VGSRRVLGVFVGHFLIWTLWCLKEKKRSGGESGHKEKKREENRVRETREKRGRKESEKERKKQRESERGELTSKR